MIQRTIQKPPVFAHHFLSARLSEHSSVDFENKNKILHSKNDFWI